MSSQTSYKPRYTLAHITKNKIWPYKDSYLRRFYEFRARRVSRWGLFRRCVLVATTMKWTQARRFIRPYTRRKGRVAGGAGITAYGKPLKRRYRDSFYIKQQLRFFHGKRKEEAFRQIFRNSRTIIGKPSSAFFSVLESRLDRVFFRRRLLPTIYACHQYIQHQGLVVNNSIEKSPCAQVRMGDIVEIPCSTWKPFYWDLFCRVYYRRWGLFIYRRRLYTQLKKKLFSVQGRRYRRTVFNRSFNTSIFSPENENSVNSNSFNFLAFKKKKFKNKSVLFNKRVNYPSPVKSFYSRFNTINPSFFKFPSGDEFNPFKKYTRFRRQKGLFFSKRYPLVWRGGVSFLSKFKGFLRNFKSFINSADYSSVTDTDGASINRVIASSLKNEGKLFLNKQLARYNQRNLVKGFQSNLSTVLIRSKKNAKNQSRQLNSLFFKQQQIQNTLAYSLFFSKELGLHVFKNKAEAYSNIFKKFQQFQKLRLSRRLGKALLLTFKPRKSSRRFGSKVAPKAKRSLYARSLTRSLYRRYKRRLQRKAKRQQMYLRQKPVHFFIPSYLQIDFRTLRAVKIKSSSPDEIFHPFRASFAKRRSFYKARGI